MGRWGVCEQGSKTSRTLSLLCKLTVAQKRNPPLSHVREVHFFKHVAGDNTLGVVDNCQEVTCH